MGVIEKTLGKPAFLDTGSLSGATGGDGDSPKPLQGERRVRLVMEVAGGSEEDGDDRKPRSCDEGTSAQQSLLMSTMSPQTSCDTELQGSNQVLVHQNSLDGAGSLADMGDGAGPGHHPMVLEGEEEEKGPLRSKAEFLLLLTSLAIGTRSMLQYPAMAMKHGGGAFMFVYLVMVGLLGLPLLYMEISLGQYARGGPIPAWKITPLSRGLAYSMLVVTSLLLVYRNTCTAWSVFYWVASLAGSLPWDPTNITDWTQSQLDTSVHQLSSLLNANVTAINSTASRINLHFITNNITTNSTINNRSIMHILDGYYRCHYAQKYFYDEVLNASPNIGEMGGIQVYLFLCLAFTWVVTGLAVAWGPQSMSRMAYVTGTVPAILLLILLGGACTLSGSVTGVRAFLTPRWQELARLQVWWDGAKLVLMGFASGTGLIISLSAWAHFHSKCFRNSVIITVISVIITALGGCVVFAALGSQLLTETGDIGELHMTDIDLAFGLLPSMASRLPVPPLWLVMWFAALTLGGIGVQAGLLHVVHDTVVTLARAEQRRWQAFLLVVLVLLLLLLGLGTVTQGGIYVVQFLEHYVYLLAVPAVCLAEVMILMWLYGVQRFANRITDMTGNSESFLWKWMWKFLCPTVLTGVIVISFTRSTSFSSPSTSLFSSLSLLTSSVTSATSPPFSSARLSPPKPSTPPPPLLSSMPLSTSPVEPEWAVGVGLFLTCLPLLPALIMAVYLFFDSSGSFVQRLKALGTTARSWGPRHLEHEPQLELPDYVICSPDVYRPANALALLTANLYLPNLTNFLNVEQGKEETSDMSGGYLSDLMTISSSEDDSGDEENRTRGNWSGRFEFVFTCLGYVVGLGNIWRFPYLVYRNGGGAFFIAYLVMMVFCGMPLVFMELSIGQFASLGPITVWKAAPLFKGVGYTMVLISALVSVYYNMVTAWAFHFLFTSLTSRLPWGFCNNTWNTLSCTINKYAADNCSTINQTVLQWSAHQNFSCYAVLSNCSGYDSDEVGRCVGALRDLAGEDAVQSYHKIGTNYTSPSEEYFYRSVLDVSSGLGRLGSLKWQMVLCLLLCWVIVFFCLLRGIKTAGKVSYVVVLVPYIAVLILLMRGVAMTGSSDGIHFYTTPKWELLRQPRMWGDAAAQVFFSLSVCWGGLTTLASYNKFHNNVYRDALLVCLGDTLMSILAGFAVFAMIGVLSERLGASVKDVIQSDVGMTFIVYPAALLSFPIPSLWSVLFFLTLVTMGLGTTFCTIETIITAISDENPSFFKKKRVVMLSITCAVSFLIGLPLAAQGGLYLLQMMDDYLCTFPLMIAGIVMCLGIAWVYGLSQFCHDIEHMIKSKVGLWWKVMWSSLSPIVILFIIIISAVGYQSLGEQFDYEKYPWWSEVVGWFLVLFAIAPILIWPTYKVSRSGGSLVKRLQALCRPTRDWGPALEKNSYYVEYFPAVQTNLLAVELEHPPLNTITGHKTDANLEHWVKEQESISAYHQSRTPDRVEFTTVGVRVPSVSQPSLLPVSQPVTPQHPNGARVKVTKPLDMRQKAILNHAYSNPQCHLSNGSIEKLTPGTRMASSSDGALNVATPGNSVAPPPRVRKRPIMKEVATQTDVSCFEKIRRQVSEPIGRATTPPSPEGLPRSMSWMQEGEPAVIEVEVTRF